MTHKPIRTYICSNSLTMEDIHERGSKAHPFEWLGVNQRIVDTARSHGMDLSVGPVRETLSEIALRILDGLKVDAGFRWDKETGAWVKPVPIVPDCP